MCLLNLLNFSVKLNSQCNIPVPVHTPRHAITLSSPLADICYEKKWVPSQAQSPQTFTLRTQAKTSTVFHSIRMAGIESAPSVP